jgi:transcription-repair coupling factor (superfamily II helicase)
MDLIGITETLSRTPALRRLGEETSAGNYRLTVGASDAAKAAAIGALALGQKAPVLVLTSKEDRAERLAEELAVWLGDAMQVLEFPERDVLPYERLAPAPDTLRDRLLVLSALRDGRPAVVVACGLAIAQRTLNNRGRDHCTGYIPAAAGCRGFPARPDRDGLRRRGGRTGAGSGGRRGGIVDVFPTAEFPSASN